MSDADVRPEKPAAFSLGCGMVNQAERGSAMMKVQSFIGKVSIGGLQQMDQQVNEWMKRAKIKPAYVCQCFGTDIHHDGRGNEPIIVVTVWYEDTGDVMRDF